MFRSKQRKRQNHRKSAQSRRIGLGLESLESRKLLAVIPVSLNHGTLDIDGSSEADQVAVSQVGDHLRVTRNGESFSFAADAVRRITFSGGDGNDNFRNDTNIRCQISGGNGDDVLRGGGGNDAISGGNGNDWIAARGGNDTIWGDLGNDTIYGGDGNDYLYGEEGHDRLAGQAGNDRIYGDIGNDLLWGGTGDDYLYGGEGADRLYGMDGDDRLRGDAGNDRLYGGAGNDRIEGGDGADLLIGGDGNDELLGGAQADRLYGYAGNDVLRGGSGNDLLGGGLGDDTVYGDDGADRVYGGDGDDHLYGGAGSDRMFGGAGRDTLVSIDGGVGDFLRGNAGFDSFWMDQNPGGGASDTFDATIGEFATNVHRITSFANGADRTLDGDNIADPTDGSHYKNFADRPLFATAGPSLNDIDQGSLGDCWLMASMGAVAATSQNAVFQTVVSLGDGTFAVRLGGDQFYRVDADLPTTGAASSTPSFAGLGIENSLWAAIVEKAYTHFRSGANTYASIASGLGREGLPGLNATGTGDKYFATYASGQAILNDIANRLASDQAVTTGFDAVSAGAPVVAGHEYTAVGVNRNASGDVVSVILRNPWGPSGADALVTLTGAQLFDYAGSIAWGNVA